MSGDKPTILDDLRYHAASLNEPEGGYRRLCGRAAEELGRVAGLLSPVTCLDCKQKIERANEWYRCFDCKSHLCENCVGKHFGASYSRHHETMQQYIDRIAYLETQMKKMRLMNMKIGHED